MPLPLKLLTTALALAAVGWWASFVRAAVRTFRTGAPFALRGHRGGAAPVEARFGRLGAAVVTAIVSGIAYAVVRVAFAMWLDH